MSGLDPLNVPSLEVALANSTAKWQADLERLCTIAKDLFADVVWELQPSEDENDFSSPLKATEEIWGHKAIVYARAPPQFQASYFSFRPAPSGTPIPGSAYSPSATPDPDNSVMSLVSPSGSPTPEQRPSLSMAPMNGLLRIPITYTPLFASEIEHLYNGKGLPQAAFDFLFAPISTTSASATEAANANETPTDKLRKDLVYMWRARLYSDIKIALTGDDTSAKTHEGQVAVFAAHRFMLAARSPYFYAQLVSWQARLANIPSTADDPEDDASTKIQTVTLPAPPFTPATLHFTLGYLYSGTLSFSHRTYDLATALALLKSALYLQINELESEVRLRVIEEMMHGLAYAPRSDEDYRELIQKYRKEHSEVISWGVNIANQNCHCKTCIRRAPRLLAYASSPDVNDPVILRGSKRILTSLFAAGWVNSEFAQLGPSLHSVMTTCVKKEMSAATLLPLLIAIKDGVNKTESPSKDKEFTESDRSSVKALILDVRDAADQFLCTQPNTTAFFTSKPFLDIVDRDGTGFSDMDHVELLCEALKRGLSPANAGRMYASLLENVLLATKTLPSGDLTTDLMLEEQGVLRSRLEDMRSTLFEYLKLRWKVVKLQGGFAGVARWVCTEIADDLNIRVDDIYDPTPLAALPRPKPDQPLKAKAKVMTTTTPNRAVPRKSFEPYKSAPFPVSTLRESVSSKAGSSKIADRPKSTAVSTRSRISASANLRNSVAASTSKETDISDSASFVSAKTTRTTTTVKSTRTARQSRPSSPPAPSVMLTETNGDTTSIAEQLDDDTRPKSAAPASPAGSVKSMSASLSSTPLPKTIVRKVTPSNASTTSRAPTLAASTASPRLSTVSNASTTRKATNAALAKSPSLANVRARTQSAASVASLASTKTAKTVAGSITAPGTPRTPRLSTISTTSRASLTPSKIAPSTKLSVPQNGAASAKSIKRSPSSSSIKSSVSVRSTTSGVSGTPKKTVIKKIVPAVPAVPKSIKENETPTPSSPSTAKAQSILADLTEVEPPAEVASSEVNGHDRKSSVETLKTTHDQEGSPKKKSDLMTESRTSRTEDFNERPYVYPIVRGEAFGASLSVGIPCIITARRRRFRAFARYIGEVTGEAGPWVGVEVPLANVDDTINGMWGTDGEGDGTWHGVRYFDLNDNQRFYSSSSMKRSLADSFNPRDLKRIRSGSPATSDTNVNSEMIGIFVRPSQILYVVEADSDL